MFKENKLEVGNTVITFDEETQQFNFKYALDETEYLSDKFKVYPDFTVVCLEDNNTISVKNDSLWGGDKSIPFDQEISQDELVDVIVSINKCVQQ